MQALRLDAIPFASQTDYIRLTAITYQSFGLDKKMTSFCRNLSFFWQGWQDSNLRMQQSKCCVLPLDDTPKKVKKNGVDNRIRTGDLQGHNLAL